MIKRSVKIVLGGEEREIKYTINAIEEIESKLSKHNIFEFINQQPWSFTDMTYVLYCGLKSKDNSLRLEQVVSWIEEYAQEQENGYSNLPHYIFAALGISGLIGGNKSAFENILKSLEADNTIEKK